MTLFSSLMVKTAESFVVFSGASDKLSVQKKDRNVFFLDEFYC